MSDASSGKADIRGVIAEGWQDNTGWADVKLDYSLDRNHPHSGKYAQKVVITRGFTQFVQPTKFVAGRHSAEVWLRADSAMWVSLVLRQSGTPYTAYGTSTARIGKQWTKLKVEALTPVEDGLLMVNAYGPGTLWVDDAGYAPSKVQAVTLHPSSLPIPRSYFGLNVCHMHDGSGFLWPALDFGAYRTWDSGVTWAIIQKNMRGEYDWSNIDRDVEQAGKHNTQFLLTLGQTPRWASSDPDKPAVYGLGLGAPPADIHDWEAFVHATATRFKGGIHAYEIWNEPDIEQFYTGLPAQMVPLEKATSKVVRSIDRNAIIVSPAVSSGHSVGSLRWFDDYLTAGGGKSCDVVAFHLYTSMPELDIDSMRAFKSLLAAHGLSNKPIWNTESGLDVTGRTTEEAVAYLSREYIIDWAVGFQRLYLYAYDGHPFTGLDVRGKPDQLADTGIAYREAKRWLEGACMKACGSDANGVWTSVLTRDDGSYSWLLWNPDGPRDYVIPAAWKVKTVHNLAGTSNKLIGKSIRIGIAPLMLTR